MMPLNVVLSVNDVRIGHVKITRIRPRNRTTASGGTVEPDAGTLCTYKWEVTLAGLPTVRSLRDQEVTHAYGRNPWDLVWKVLLAAHYSDGWPEADRGGK